MRPDLDKDDSEEIKALLFRFSDIRHVDNV